jgi:hypothetical protein
MNISWIRAEHFLLPSGITPSILVDLLKQIDIDGNSYRLRVLHLSLQMILVFSFMVRAGLWIYEGYRALKAMSFWWTLLIVFWIILSTSCLYAIWFAVLAFSVFLSGSR